jgi:hypothetical protein
MIEREAVVWCPACKADKYEIRRIPTGQEGVFRHVTYPESIPAEAKKFCVCGAVLERKPT